MGVRIDGIDKITYNHADSYPAGLGKDMVLALETCLLDYKLDGLKKLARDIRVVVPNSTPSPEDIEHYRVYFEKVGTGQPTEWYALLRALQGNLRGTLEAGIMIDGQDTLRNSLYCEWAYIVNLDTEKFEVYRGFQRNPHKSGRFYALPPYKTRTEAFYPVALLAELPFEKLPETFDPQALHDAPEAPPPPPPKTVWERLNEDT
jgi:hypothetical protein